MKTLKFLLIALLALNMGMACSKNESSPVLPVENPLTDLPWLKAEVDEITLAIQNGSPLSVSIYQCVYGDSETGFLVDIGNMNPFYNCTGEILCIMGGFAGETCSELNIVSKKLIWKVKNNGMNNSCEVENPLTDLLWLKEIIGVWEVNAAAGYLRHARIYQCAYRDGIGFWVEPCVGCPDASSVFNSYDGELLCSWGGMGRR